MLCFKKRKVFLIKLTNIFKEVTELVFTFYFTIHFLIYYSKISAIASIKTVAIFDNYYSFMTSINTLFSRHSLCHTILKFPLPLWSFPTNFLGGCFSPVSFNVLQIFILDSLLPKRGLHILPG